MEAKAHSNMEKDDSAETMVDAPGRVITTREEARASIDTVSSESSDSSPRFQRIQLTRSHASSHPEGDAEELSHYLNRRESHKLTRNQTGRSTATNATSDPAYEVDFDEDDPGNPQNWSMWRKSMIIFFVSYSTMTVVLYSTSYTASIPGILITFHISNELLGILGVTTYLLGLALGSVILAPLSEMYGRRPVYLVSMAFFTLLILPCALAPNLEAILITRFFGAFCGSAMIGNAPGTVNDIVSEEYRALAFSIWSIGPMNGPVIGPLVGGFAYEYLGWRWTNWVVIIAAGVASVMIFCIPETYGPAILRARAAAKRKETGNQKYWTVYDEKKEFWPLLKLNLSRPFVLMVTEYICIFWDLYIALVYGVLYLCFVAYPIVFSDLRGWSPGITGLAYCGIGTGSLIVIACEPLIRKMINSHKPDPETGKPPPESMVSIVCIAGILIPIGELIFAWTCTPNVHWIVPILAGIPFGAGNVAVFIYASNYLVHSYGIYAASALAGNAVLRSAFGATLPLAGPKMYSTLGPHWAGTLLALLELIMAPIPFVFYRYGAKIRVKSALIRQMREDRERLERKKERAAGLNRTEAVEEKVLNRTEEATAEPAAEGAMTAVDEEKALERGLGKEMKG